MNKKASLNPIRIATQEDDELALLKHTITQGWPGTIKDVPSILQPYWTFRVELTIEDGIVLKGTQIVMPAKKCEAVLKLICEGHLGLNKCKFTGQDLMTSLRDLFWIVNYVWNTHILSASRSQVHL